MPSPPGRVTWLILVDLKQTIGFTTLLHHVTEFSIFHVAIKHDGYLIQLEL
jgi:hypothetical protein